MSKKQNSSAKKALNIKSRRPVEQSSKKTSDKGMETLQGQFLVAMPLMGDSRFKDSVLYVVEHNSDGAMAIGINEIMPNIVFGDVIADIDLHNSNSAQYSEIVVSEEIAQQGVLKGGPVQINRGFVVHSVETPTHGVSFKINEQTAISSNLEILVSLAMDDAPEKSLFALGYCGWSPGQLEEELAQNAWLTVPFSSEILFNTAFEKRYDKSLEMLGITRATLSAYSGRA